MPVLLLLSRPKMFFASQGDTCFDRREIWHGGAQPSKSSTFGILSTNLSTRRDSFWTFYASIGSLCIFNLVAFWEQSLNQVISIFCQWGISPQICDSETTDGSKKVREVQKLLYCGAVLKRPLLTSYKEHKTAQCSPLLSAHRYSITHLPQR